MGDLEARILDLLEGDARLSNSEIARALDVSEGFVRSRIKKLVENSSVSLGLIVDFSVLDVSVLANVRVRFEAGQLERALKKITALEASSLVLSTTGHFNVFTILEARDHSDLARILRQEVRAIPGYLDMSLSIIDQAFKYDPRHLPMASEL